MAWLIGLIYTSLGVLVVWCVLGLADALADRRRPRVIQRQPGPYVPHRARTGHLPPPPVFPPSPASGRHARRTTR